MEDLDSDFSSSDDDTELERRRFQGKAETWLRYTADERGIAAALEQQEANDLSRHLYNAHALKAATRNKALVEDKTYDNKQPWTKTSGDRDSRGPPPTWTAWPLKATEVPRSVEQYGSIEAIKTADTGNSQEPWSVDADIRDEVFSLIMRKAKDQLKQLASSPKDASDSEQRTSTTTTRLPDNERSQALQITSDDQLASVIVAPEVDQIVSQLDRLLLALHKSRQGHLTRSKAALQARADVIATAHSSSGSDAEDGVEGTATPSQPRLAQRDWSEILGFASMIGWDSAVVQRASQRCQNLFDESMNWWQISNPDGEPPAAQDSSELTADCPVKSCATARGAKAHAASKLLAQTHVRSASKDYLEDVLETMLTTKRRKITRAA